MFGMYNDIFVPSVKKNRTFPGGDIDVSWIKQKSCPLINNHKVKPCPLINMHDSPSKYNRVHLLTISNIYTKYDTNHIFPSDDTMITY